MDCRNIRSFDSEDPKIQMGLSEIWLPYAQMKTAPAPLEVARTKGVSMHLADGRMLIDGIASWWTACHGYNHPGIRKAVAEQLEVLPHVMLGGLVHAPVRELSHRLATSLPGDLNHSFFSESGSVAVEVAMKIAVQYWLNLGERGRTRFLSFEHGYHGDTFAAMSVCDPLEGMHKMFAGAIAEQCVLPLPRSDEELSQFETTLSEEHGHLAALIVEPLVQAAGGFHFHSADDLRRIVELARKYDLLVIFDEIATGFGRTGTMYACEQAGVLPDIITLSKALTGGTLPLAVTTARRAVFEAFLSDEFEAALMHGPTYSGNPLACAAANASLDLFESEPRLAQVASIEAQLTRELESCRKLPGVRDVRCKGAIGVVELERDPDLDELRRRFIGSGVWIRPFGKTVYLMPALTIAPDELSVLTSAIHEVLHEYLK